MQSEVLIALSSNLETIRDDANWTIKVGYITLGSYSIVNVFYHKKQSRTYGNGTTTDYVGVIPSKYYPTEYRSGSISDGRLSTQLTPNGDIIIQNLTGSSITISTWNGVYTYIVPTI